MDKNAGKYLSLVLSVMLLFVAGVAGVNYTVDPYGIYREWKPGDVFPASDTYVRVHKTERIKRLKPDVIVLGTSRADIGINPKQEFFPGQRPYNAALSAAMVREQRMLLEFAHRISPLKKVIITLDCFTFNTHNFENRHFEPELVDDKALTAWGRFFNTYRTLLSFDTLLVLRNHFSYMKKLERKSYPRANGNKQHAEAEWRAKNFGVNAVFYRDPNAHVLGAEDFGYNYSDKPGDDTLSEYRAMLEFCRRNGIEVVQFFTPLYVEHLDEMKKQGKWEIFEDWKRRVADISRDYNAPLWDFATYNSVTTEPMVPESDKKTQLKYFWDIGHYKANVGDMILKKILGIKHKDEHPDFGKRLV